MGKKRKGSGKPKPKSDNAAPMSDNESLTEDIFTDEISEFTEARNKVNLDERDDDSNDEEGIFDLLDDEDESDEEIGEWSKRLKQIKFQTKIDKKQKVDSDAPEKSWGKKRSDFYGSGVRRKPKDTGTDEEDEWVMEEREIEKLQKRLDEDIDEEDFLVPVLTKSKGEKKGELQVSREMTEKEKEVFAKQSHPEREPLREELSACLEKVQSLKNRKGWMVESRDTVYRLLGANIAFYLHMLESGEDTRGHPVLHRIIQWKKLAKIYDTIQDDDDEEDENEDASDDEQTSPTDSAPAAAKRARLTLNDSEEEVEDGEEDPTQSNEEDDLHNRPVTYEIEKNKPKKKTAPNNPRVKHREKFRKAKIRRKGKIRDYRPEINKYQGEMSGIRTGIIRSVKLA